MLLGMILSRMLLLEVLLVYTLIWKNDVNFPQNTPIPGTYHLKTFIEESLLNPVAATYNFKNEGRKKPPLVQRNDPVVTDLPPYMPPDFLDLLKKQTATYSFKDQPRSSPSSLVYRDQVKPCWQLGFCGKATKSPEENSLHNFQCISPGTK